MITSNLELKYSVEYFTIRFKTDIADLLKLLFILEIYMLNKNQRIFENIVYSVDEILLLESLHLKFINERRVYRPNPYADHYYANVPKREALNLSDFDNYESIKTFFYSELEKGRSEFRFFKHPRYFATKMILLKYHNRLRHGLENNKPITFNIGEIKHDIKDVMYDIFEDIKSDIK